MIKPLSLQQLSDCFGGECVHGDARFDNVSTDTRNIQQGDLFVALKGERFDAHDFLDVAVKKGATSLVVDHAIENISIPQWVVGDTTLALGNIARLTRDDFTGHLVAITGSSGKTTVKEMLQAIFLAASDEQSVFATKGNFNNHIGVPLSLFSLSDAHQYAVIEMGASAMGEIDYLTHMALPDVAMVNNVMPAHIEGFGSLENIATAKGEIYDGLGDGGIAVINIDDQFSSQWIEKNNHRSTVIFSVKGDSRATIQASNILCDKEGYPSFHLKIEGETVSVRLNILGQHNVANALAACACAYALQLSPEVIVKGLMAFSPVDGRLKTFAACNGATVIDDSYNANPGSVRAAIDVLAAMTEETTVLVLGNMAELGDYAIQEHKDIGEYANKQKIDYVMTVGDLAVLSAQSFGDQGLQFSSSAQLADAAKAMSDSNTVFLVKGSRSSRMDRVVDALKQRGEHDAALVS